MKTPRGTARGLRRISAAPSLNIAAYQTDVALTHVGRLATHLRCTMADAQRYDDLREEGYSRAQALLMAGLADPSWTEPVETESDLAIDAWRTFCVANGAVI